MFQQLPIQNRLVVPNPWPQSHFAGSLSSHQLDARRAPLTSYNCRVAVSQFILIFMLLDLSGVSFWRPRRFQRQQDTQRLTARSTPSPTQPPARTRRRSNELLLRYHNAVCPVLGLNKTKSVLPSLLKSAVPIKSILQAKSDRRRR